MVTTRPVSPSNDPTARRRLVLAGLAVIIVFAVIGVVSAGIFLGSALGSTGKTTGGIIHPTVAVSSLQDVHRAQVQATNIVSQARKSGQTVARDITARARARATALVAAAKKSAGAIGASSPAPGAPSSPSSTATGNSSTTIPGTTGAAPSSTVVSGTSASGGAAGTPDLSGVPASWKVVAYNAALGTGSRVGTVSVLNRGSGTFSGTVKIAYNRGGAAYASFSGLGPGHSEVLTLSGSPYPGGGYTILLPAVH